VALLARPASAMPCRASIRSTAGGNGNRAVRRAWQSCSLLGFGRWSVSAFEVGADNIFKAVKGLLVGDEAVFEFG
jgi:hypothetical protein